MNQQADTADWVLKLRLVAKQTKQMMDPVRPFVRCGCERKLWPHQAFRCLYCGEWFCQPCAEYHFGKTRAEYRAEHPVPAGIEPPEQIADTLENSRMNR